MRRQAEHTRTSGTKRALLLIAIAGLLLSVLTLGASTSASAQASCEAGEALGIRCEIEGAAPIDGTCAAEFDLVAERCVRYEVAVGITLTCDVGALVDDQCVDVGEAPSEVGEPSCPPSDTVIEDADGGCYTVVAPLDTCPAGTTPDPRGACREPVDLVERTVYAPPACPAGFTTDGYRAGLCTRLEPAQQASGICPFGARGSAGSCYFVEPQAATCAVGELSGDQCRVDGNPPLPTAPFCPTSDFVLDNDDQCYTLSPAIDGECTLPFYSGTEPDQCRRAVNLVSGQSVCEFGYALIANRCVGYEAPLLLGCSAAAPADAFGLCRRPVADQADTWYCADGGEQLDGTECVLQLPVWTCPYDDAIVGCGDPAPSCPDGFLLDPAGAGCLATRPTTQLPDGCPEGSRGVVNGCYILVAKGPASSPGAPPQCPVGSAEDSRGDCRKPVANARGAYYCPNPFATLNGRTCIVAAEQTARCSDSLDTALEPCIGDRGCPQGYELDAELPDTCVRSRPAVFAAAACRGRIGAEGNCYRYVRGNPSADAECLEGTLTFGFCELTGEVLATEFVCPESSTVIELGDECYTLVSPPLVESYTYYALPCREGETIPFDDQQCRELGYILGGCPANTTADPGGLCRRPVARYEIPSVCEAGYLQVSSRCLGYVSPQSNNPRCVTGEVEFELGCRYPSGDAQGIFYCEDPANEFEFFNTCVVSAPYSLACTDAQLESGECGPAPRLCPDGYSPDDSLGGICARFEPASQLPASCPIGARGEAGDCYFLVARGPVGPSTCAQGTLIGSNCVITGNPPTPGPGSCPVSATVFEDADGCYTFVAQANAACPGDPDPEADPAGCRTPVELEPGPLVCETGFGLVNGECLRYAAPTRPDSVCPQNSTEDENGDCRKPVADAAGAYFCAAAAASLNGRSCVFTAPFDVTCDPTNGACGTANIVEVCPASTDGIDCFVLLAYTVACPETASVVVTAVGRECREAVETVAGPTGCAAGFTAADEVCVRYLPAQAELDCRGRDATTCSGVLGAAQALDAAELVSLAATNISYVSCIGAVASYAVIDGTTTVATGDLTESDPGVYAASYVAAASGSFELEITVTCPDGREEVAIDELVFIDPSGFVLDCGGDVVVGAEVTLLRSDTATGPLVAVADGDATIMDPLVNVSNPSLTGADGRYRWDVVAGFYQVRAAVAGQPVVLSEVLEVPPERTDVDLVFPALDCATSAVTTRSTVQVSAPIAGPTTAGPMVVPAAATPTASSPTSLALTGTDVGLVAASGLSLVTAGAACCIAARHRRRDRI